MAKALRHTLVAVVAHIDLLTVKCDRLSIEREKLLQSKHAVSGLCLESKLLRRLAFAARIALRR